MESKLQCISRFIFVLEIFWVLFYSHFSYQESYTLQFTRGFTDVVPFLLFTALSNAIYSLVIKSLCVRCFITFFNLMNKIASILFLESENLNFTIIGCLPLLADLNLLNNRLSFSTCRFQFRESIHIILRCVVFSILSRHLIFITIFLNIILRCVVFSILSRHLTFIFAS